jgi:hypothetical protein
LYQKKEQYVEPGLLLCYLSGGKGLLINQFSQKTPYRTGHGNKNIAHAQKDEDYFNGKNDCREQKEIGKEENDASPDAFMAPAEEEQPADLEE